MKRQIINFILFGIAFFFSILANYRRLTRVQHDEKIKNKCDVELKDVEMQSH